MRVIYPPKGRGRGQSGHLKKTPYTPFSARGVIVCDTCEADLRNDAVREFPTKDGGSRISLICPLCEAQYPVVTISPNGVLLRSRISRLRNTGKGQSPQCRALEAQYKREVSLLAKQGKP